MAIDQTIAKFQTVAAKRDFARDNLFRVLAVSCRGLTLSEEDILYCKGGAIPGRKIPHGTVAYMGMKMPYPQSTVEYPEAQNYSLEFYYDAKGEVAQKFERASRFLFNDKSSTGDWRFPDMADRISLVALDQHGEPIETITFKGVSFMDFQKIDTKTADGDGVAIGITCSFTFISYEREGSNTVWSGEQ